MITTTRGYHTATCDVCGAELDSVMRKSEAVCEMDMAGWECKYTDDGWVDLCAKCRKWNTKDQETQARFEPKRAAS